MEKKIRIMSGMRTSGMLHIGHYFGALKNWISLQENYECFFGIMDWHGMTTAFRQTEEISLWNREMFAEFLAWGINPEKTILFIQSKVPEHLELFTIFANITPITWLERVPTWKDAEEEMKLTDTHNLGRFSYPVLQAADIAAYKGEKVPVGLDQVSHLELTREIIRRCNHIYKTQLPEPSPLLTKTPLVQGLDGRKMSKSYNNGVLLTEEAKSIQNKIKKMGTDPQRVHRNDPGDPEKCNVFTYHKLFSSNEEQKWVTEGCRSAGIGCGDCKAVLIKNMENLIAQPRERKIQLMSQPQKLDELIQVGCRKARAEAQQTLSYIKNEMKIK